MSNLLTENPAEVVDDAALEDAFAIDYAILPEAPEPLKRRRSFWEIFLLGWETFTPKLPARSEVTAVRRRS